MKDWILVAGIGNIFLGDDAFGVEVARRLSLRKMPPSVRVIDFGIRGLDLAYALMDGYELVILVDATPRGGKPGTVYVIEPDIAKLEIRDSGVVDAHAMDPVQVLTFVKRLGGDSSPLLIVGCEPERTGEEGEGIMGLSESVSAAIDEAIRVIESQLRLSGRTILAQTQETTTSENTLVDNT